MIPGGIFSLSFRTDNAAFERDGQEVSRILKDIANKVYADGHDYGMVFDVNGNSVGEWSWDIDEGECDE